MISGPNFVSSQNLPNLSKKIRNIYETWELGRIIFWNLVTGTGTVFGASRCLDLSPKWYRGGICFLGDNKNL